MRAVYDERDSSALMVTMQRSTAHVKIWLENFAELNVHNWAILKPELSLGSSLLFV